MDVAHKPKIAETVIDPTVRLREADIGRRCEILAHTRVEYSSLGDYSYLGEHCDVADTVIGKFTAIANAVRIGAPNHPMDRPSQHRFTYCPEYYEATATRDQGFFADRRGARVTIANDCWIGHGAIILPSVPARPIRRRFSDAVAEKLCRIAWWNWPDEVIFARLADFRSEQIEAFCERYDPAR
jgi:acetyltransferase-like isoleucine patch superfamily enzyme